MNRNEYAEMQSADLKIDKKKPDCKLYNLYKYIFGA